jgi:hypothetical protein
VLNRVAIKGMAVLGRALCLLLSYLESVQASSDNTIWRKDILSSIHKAYPQISQRKISFSEMVQIAALCSIVPALWFLRRKRQDKKLQPWTSDDASSVHEAMVRREHADSNGKFLNWVQIFDLTSSRSRGYRSWTFEKAF